MFRFYKVFFFIGLIFIAFGSNAQLKPKGASMEGTTDFGDPYFIYCASQQGESIGELTAVSRFDSSTFVWEKYDSLNNVFVLVGNQYTILSDSLQSSISNLDDGCYRVTISADGNSYEEQAWILHNWITVTYTEIPDSSSNCEEFKIWADYTSAPLLVYDTKNGAERSVRKPNGKFTFIWKQEQTVVSNVLSPLITHDLIASETPVEYRLTINDEFDCTGEGSVEYDSKVTHAEFVADPMEGEAVLEVTFTNNSINYDSTIWFFNKDAFRYSLEVEAAGDVPVDSLDFILYDDAPIYKYEYSGEYRVYLVTVKMNETGNCRDTFYMDAGSFINVKESLVDVPNVFTPNGDGVNDVWMIQSQSLKSMNIKVYNRWGGLVYSWKYSTITTSDDTYEHAVWDGRIGNKMAAPGVYYYVINYEGRDIWKENLTKEEQKIQIDRIGKPVKDTKTGFVHLFRDKY